MISFLRAFLLSLFFASIYFSPIASIGQVTVTPAVTTTGNKICERGGSVQLTDVVITETSPDDIGGDASDHVGITFVLEAPSGFNFVNGDGGVSVTPGGDVINASIIGWTATTVTIQFDANNSTGPDILDEIKISDLGLLAVSGVPQTNVDVIRNGGTAVITNLPNSTVLATVSSTVDTTLSVSVDNSTICPNQAVKVTIASSELGINYQVFDTSNTPLSSATPGDGLNLEITTSPIASSVTLKVVATDGASTCSTELQQQEVITVALPPTVDAGITTVEVCSTSLSYQITTASASNGSILWSHTGQGSFDDASAIDPKYTFDPADAGNVVTFTIGVTGAGSCGEVTDSFDLTITAAPEAEAGVNNEICDTALTYQITTASAANGTISWTHDGHGSFDDPSIINPTYTLLPTDAGNVVTFTLLVTGTGSCGSTSDIATLAITPAAQANAGSDAEICFGDTFNFTSQSTPATAANYASISWSTTGLGTLNNFTTLTPNYIPAVNESGLITFTLTAQHNGSCVNATDQMTLFIHPQPTFALTNTNPSLCSGTPTAIGLNGSPVGSVITLVSVTPSDPGVTGFSAVGSAYPYASLPASITDNLSNSTTSVQTVVYEFEVSVGTCINPVHKTAAVTVRPIPDLSLNNHAILICSGSTTNIDLKDPTNGAVIKLISVSAAAGVTGYSAVNSTFANDSKVTNVLTNTTGIPQDVTYTFQSTANGCTDPGSEVATVTVEPSPVFTVSNTTASSICSGDATAIVLASSTANAVIELVSVTPSAAGVAGYSAAGTLYPPASLTIADILTNTTTSDQTVVYEFEVSVNAGSCVNPVHKTAAVTVRPIPDLSLNNHAILICSGGTTNIDLKDPTNGAVIKLISVSAAAGVTGYSAVNSTFANDSKVTNVLTNTTGIPQDVTYTFQSTANGCTDPGSEVATVTVEPSPVFTVSNTTASSICSGDATAIVLASSTANAVIELVSVTPSAAGVAGYSAAGTLYPPASLTIADILTNTTTSVQTVVYEFEVSVNAGSCVNPVHKTAAVTVRPIPDLSLNNHATLICSGGTTNIDLKDPTNGAVIKLISVSAAAGVTGYSAVNSTFANDSKVTNVLTNTTGIPQDVTYTFQSTANGCTDPGSEVATVTVEPSPVFTVSNTTASSICSGDATAIVLASSTANAVIELVSVTPSAAGVAGYSAAGTLYPPASLTIADILTNTTTSVQTVVYEFEVSVNAGSCVNPVHKTAAVTVRPIPDLSLNNHAILICSGGTTNIDLKDPTNGAVIKLISVSAAAGVTGYSAVNSTFANDSKVTNVLTNTTGIPQDVTYTFQSTANGCTDPGSEVATVTVEPAPVFTVSNTTASSICSGDATAIVLASSTANAVIELVSVTPSAAGVAGYSAAGTLYPPASLTIADILTNTTTSDQTVVYEFEVSVGSCVNPVHKTATVTVRRVPLLTSANHTSTIASGKNTDFDLFDSTNGVVITLESVSATDPTVSGYSVVGSKFANGSKVTDVLINTTSSLQTVTYKFRSSANGCAAPGLEVVTVNVSPGGVFVVTNGSPQICSGDVTSLTINSPTAGATVELFSVTPSNAGLTGYTPATTVFSLFPHTINDALVNPTTSPQTVEYEFEVSVSGVPNPVHEFATVWINPIPTLTITNNLSSICSGTPTDIDFSSPTSGAVIKLETVTPGAVTGTSAVGTTFASGSKLKDLLENLTASPISVIYDFSVTANGCTTGGFSATVNVAPALEFTVKNNPVTTDPVTLCSGDNQDIDLTTSVTGAKITVTSVTISPAAGSVTGVLTVGTAYTSFPGTQNITGALVNTSNSPQTVVYEFEMSIGTCINLVHQKATIVVNPAPVMTISDPLPSSICSGVAVDITLASPTSGAIITLTSVDYGGVTGTLSANTTYTPGSVINEVLQNTTTASVPVTYNFSVTANGCTTGGFSKIVNVAPALEFTIKNNPITADPVTLCSGDNQDIDLTTSVTGAKITVTSVTVSPAAGSVTGVLTVGTAYTSFPGTQNITGALVNTSNSPQTVVYEFEMSIGTCINLVHQKATIVVNPAPVMTISDPLPSSICSGAAVDITLASPTSGAIITLTSVDYGGVTGTLSANTTYTPGSVINEVLQNTTTASVPVTYNFSVTANGCTTGGFSKIVNVAPALEFTVKNNPITADPVTLCSGDNQDIDLTTSVTGAKITVASVTISPAAGSVTGVLTVGTAYTSFPGTQNIAGALVNTSNIPQTVVYEFEMSVNAGSCVNLVHQKATIVVNPMPTLIVTNTPSSICSGVQTDIGFSTSTSGAVIKLETVTPGAVTGTSATGTTFANGSKLKDLLENPTGSPVTVTYDFSVTANGCTKTGYSATVVVAPALEFTVANNPITADPVTLCSGDNQDIDLTTSVTGAKITVASVTISPAAGSVTGVLTVGTAYTSFPGTQNITGALVNTSNSPQTVVYEFEMSVNAGSCVNLVHQKATIVVNPTPAMSINNTTSSICSGTAVDITLTSPTSGGIITLTGVIYGGATGSLSNNTTYTPGSLINEILQNNGTAPALVTYYFSITANGCTTGGFSTNVTVNPNPDFTVAGGNSTICSGGQTNISFGSQTAGHQINVVSVSYGLVTGGTVTAGTTTFTDGDILAETLTNITTAAIDVVYTFNVTTPGTTPACPIVIANKQVIVRVQPQPAFTFTNAAPNICSGTQTNITLLTSVTGVQMKLANVNYNGAVGTLNNGLLYSNNQKITEVLVNNTNFPITVSYTFESFVGSCTSATQLIQVVVNPTPVINLITAQVLCAGGSTGAITFGGTGTTTYDWVNNKPSIGLAPSGTGVSGIPSFTALNSGSVPVVATITVTPRYVNGPVTCTGAGTSFTITVNPTPVVSVPVSQIICNGSSTSTVTFSGTGTSYTWTNDLPSIGLAGSGSGNIVSFVATNTGSTTVTATITVTPVYTYGAVTCTGPQQLFTISVEPTPLVNTVSNQEICNGTSTSLVTFSGTATSYSWSNDNTSIGLAGSGSGVLSIPSFTGINTGSVAQVATIVVTPHYNGCAGVTKSFTITVNPTPVVSVPSNQVICNGSSTSTVTFGGTGTSYTWTNDLPSIGLAGSGSGNIVSFVATNTGSTTVTATITVTPVYTGTIVCTGPPKMFTISVEPTPLVNTVSNQEICNGTSTSLVTFSGTATSYTWVNDTPSIGLPASGTGNIASFTGVNSGVSPVTATITITPHYNGCIGATTSFTIRVDPTPVINPITAQVLCAGGSTGAITFGGTGTTTYDWVNNKPSIGLAPSGTGVSGIASFTALNSGSVPVVATITVTPRYVNGPVTCTGAVTSFTITVNPTPVVSVPVSQTVCNGSATATINFSGTGTSYDWTNDTPSIGLASSGTGVLSIPSFTATNTGTTTVIAHLAVTPVYTYGTVTCTGPQQLFTISVEPTPLVNTVSNQEICNGTSTSLVTFSGTATSYSWSNDNTSIGLAGSGSGVLSIPSFTGINTGSVAQVATIVVTPHYNGCAGATKSFTITVNPTPVVSVPSNQVICNGSSTSTVTFGGTGTSYTWTNDLPSIGLAGSGSGNIVSFVATNTGSTTVTATITVTPVYTGTIVCTGPPKMFTISVEPTPLVNTVSNQEICNGTSTSLVTFSGTATSYTWVNDTPSIGLPASGTGNIASFTGVNSGGSPVTATITITPHYNGCIGATTSFTIRVDPTPVINPIAAQVLCAGGSTGAITFGGTGTTTYDWVNNKPSIGLAPSGTGVSGIASFTALNSGSVPVVATITVTPRYVNGPVTCTGAVTSFTITVNPTPVVSVPVSQTVCNGSATATINFSGTGTSYDWTNDTPSIGLASSGTGVLSIPSFTATNTGTTTVIAHLAVTPVYTYGTVTCTGPQQLFTISVEPTPLVNTVSNQEICNGTSTSLVTFSGTATSYSWSNDNTSIGLAGSGSGVLSIPSFTGINTGSVAQVATIVVTPHYNGCAGATKSFTITVNPTPVVSVPSNQVICNGSSTSTVTFGGTGTSYTWTNDLPSIGLAGSGSGNIVSFVATNTGSTTVTATITVTPVYTGTIVCTGPPKMFTISVEPTPLVNTVSNQEICNGTSTSLVTFSGTATSYTWVNDTPSIGLPASGTGNIASFTGVNSGVSPVTATITITPHYNGCIGATKNFTIKVNPIPAITNSVLSATRCSNEGALNFTPVLNVAGSKYVWSSTVLSGAVSGVTSGPITNTLIADNPVNIGGIPAVIRYRITPTGPLPTSCGGNFVDFMVTVNPQPVGSNATEVVCSDVRISYNLLLNVAAGNNVGSTFSWIAANNTNVVGESLTAKGGPIINDIITNVTNVNQDVIYTVTPTAITGCAGSTFQITVTVQPEPVGVTTTAPPICSGSSVNYNLQNNVNISGNNLPAVFNWKAISFANITGASATTKTGSLINDVLVNLTQVNQTAVYEITPTGTSGGCLGNIFTISVTVNPTAVFDAGPDLMVCVSSSSIQLQGTAMFAPGGILWSGGTSNFDNETSATPVYTLSPAELATTTPITLTFTMTALGSGACSSASDQMKLTINPLPVVGFVGLPASVSENDASIILSGSGSGVGGMFTITPGLGLSPTSVSGSFDVTTFDPGSATVYDNTPSSLNHITYTYTNSATGCTNSTSQTVRVNPITNIDFTIESRVNPILNATGAFEFCANQGLVKLIGNPVASSGLAPETQFIGFAAYPGGPIAPISKIGNDYFIDTDGLTSDTYGIEYDYKNTFGAITNKTREIRLFAAPVADFSTANNCIASDVVFTDNSTIKPTPFSTSIVNWQWSFDDGTASTAQNPSKRYQLSGNYDVLLKVTTTQGCTVTSAPKVLRVGDVPKVDFTWAAICNNDQTKFEDVSDPGTISTITSYQWDFGDGDILIGAKGSPVTAGSNGGRTTGVYEKPDHKYTTFGTYTPKLTVITNDGCNNTAQEKIFILPYSTVTPLATSAYQEDFEASNGGWIAEAKAPSDTSWVWGLPQGNVIKTASSGTNAWWTGLNNDTYFANEKSVVNGPCFNLTQLSRPMVSLDYWVDAERNLDGAVLQYSTDGGVHWQVVGSADPLKQDQGINWYTGIGIPSNPGDQSTGGNYGWTGVDQTAWLSGRFNLDMIPVADRDQVRLRIAFASNDTNISGRSFDGFAFDNVFVGDKTRNVLVEHFTNSTDNGSLIANTALYNLYQDQITTIPGRTSDFHDIQYHISYPKADPLNLDNEVDPAARANYMGVSQPPATIMDGKIDGVKFKGSFTEITRIELDRRALVDPQFDLELDTVETHVKNTISVQVTLKAKKAFNAPLIVQVALIENNVGTFNNVLRKQLLGADGEAVNLSWSQDQTRTVTKNDIVINVPIVNSSQLTLIAYVQDKNTKEIYQSVVVAGPKKTGAIVTGIEEEPPVPTTLNGIKIYPNPANGSFNFGVADETSPGYSWKVADQRGAVLLKGDFENAFDHRKQVDVSGLANGVYFVIISGPGQSTVYQKLVVMNRN